jgi:hypothetical protein
MDPAVYEFQVNFAPHHMSLVEFRIKVNKGTRLRSEGSTQTCIEL